MEKTPQKSNLKSLSNHCKQWTSISGFNPVNFLEYLILPGRSSSGVKITYTILILILLGILLLRLYRWFFGENGLLTEGHSGDFKIYLDYVPYMLRRENPYALATSGAFQSAPGSAPLFLLTVIPFGLLDQAVARTIWWVMNVILAFATVLLIERRMLPQTGNNRRLFTITILFLAMAPTSSGIQIGQNGLITFFLALLGILILPKHQIAAGLLIGFAFSKYSLTFLLVPYLLFSRQIKVLIIVFLIQMSGLLGLALLTTTDPIYLFISYRDMLVSFAQSPTEFNIRGLLVDMGVMDLLARLVDLIGIGVTVGAIAWYMLRSKIRNDAMDRSFLIPMLFIGSIPFVYHRLYDGVVFILLIVSWWVFWDHTNLADRQSRRVFAIVTTVVGSIFLILLIPRTIFDMSMTLRILLSYIDVGAVLAAWIFLLMCLISPHRQRFVQTTVTYGYGSVANDSIKITESESNIY